MTLDALTFVLQFIYLQVLISGSETSAERRVQIWTPDYLLTGKPRPIITSAPTSVVYSGTITLSFSAVAAIDSVTLIRPGSATHGVHFDERSVVLACAPSSNGFVACQAPPSANIAPPGLYMCFILSEGVPSMAKYISLTTAMGTKAVPLLPSSLTGLTARIAAPPEPALAPLTGASALAPLTGEPAPGPLTGAPALAPLTSAPAQAPLTGAPAQAPLKGAPAPGPSGLGDYTGSSDNTSVTLNSPGSLASQTSQMG